MPTNQELEAKLARICTNHLERPRPIGEIVLPDGTVRSVYPSTPPITHPDGRRSWWRPSV